MKMATTAVGLVVVVVAGAVADVVADAAAVVVVEDVVGSVAIGMGTIGHRTPVTIRAWIR